MHLNSCRKYQFSLQKLSIIFVICDVLWLHNETFAASAYSSSDNFATKYNDQKMLDVRGKKRQADEVESVTFIEYYMDHEVTEKEARDNLRQLKDSEFAGEFCLFLCFVLLCKTLIKILFCFLFYSTSIL